MHFGARISHLRPTWLLAFGFWLHLASLGFILAFGFTWLHLASLGFTWLHLASLGFTWLHLAYAHGSWLMAFGLVSLGFNFGRSLQLALGVCWVLVL